MPESSTRERAKQRSRARTTLCNWTRCRLCQSLMGPFYALLIVCSLDERSPVTSRNCRRLQEALLFGLPSVSHIDRSGSPVVHGCIVSRSRLTPTTFLVLSSGLIPVETKSNTVSPLQYLFRLHPSILRSCFGALQH